MSKTFNNRNGKKVNQGNQRNGGAVTTKRIDVNALYVQLKSVLAKRANLQEAYDREWEIVKSRKLDRHAQLDKIDSAIGAQTHKVNLLINDLCQYRKTHKAMNLAYSYVSREITRIERIVSHWQNVIREVNQGRSYLINSHGVSHTDTTHLENYVAKKRQQLSKLRGWLSFLARYRVA